MTVAVIGSRHPLAGETRHSPARSARRRGAVSVSGAEPGPARPRSAPGRADHSSIDDAEQARSGGSPSRPSGLLGAMQGERRHTPVGVPPSSTLAACGTCPRSAIPPRQTGGLLARTSALGDRAERARSGPLTRVA